uniref:TonB-dependent receptor n=1 Tax=Ningiella ruwaisensis TaxID=2364274 RepID=UPI00109EFF7B|nr:TonB-dependent receptor [Ningiella ruwaisensis]
MARHIKPNTHSQKNRFRKSLLALAIAGLTSGAVMAQEQEEQNPSDEESMTETIEVKGQRGNLMRAADLKRNADTFLDAIDATDISSLPDTSITEALQRVPGVAIERFAARNDPDHFSVEGTGVVIRGLTQTRSEFNGRDTFSANSGRGLSFQDVPPELVGSVQVFKNQTAEMVEGGLSGTINLTTRKAFDNPDRLFAFNTEYSYGDLREEGAGQFSLLFSDRWNTDIGEFGFLINYTHAENKFQSDGIQSAVQWDNRAILDPLVNDARTGNAAWILGNVTDSNGNEVIDASGNPIPQRTVRGAGARQKIDDRERDGGSLSLQWRSPDENTLVTAEYIRSDSSLEWQERVIEYQRNDDAVLIPVEGSPLIFDAHGYMVEGFQTAVAEYRSSDFNGDEFGRMPNTTTWDGSVEGMTPYGGLIETSTRFRHDENLVEDISLNIQHVYDDSWFLEFDVQRVEASQSTLDNSVFIGQGAVVYYKDNGDDIADIGFYDPYWVPDADFEGQLGLDSPNNAHWRASMPHITDNEGESTAFQFDAKKVFDSGFIESIKFGARRAEREQTNRATDYSDAWRGLKPHWSQNDGPGWVNLNTPEIQALARYYEVVDLSDMNDGAIVAGGRFIAPTMELVKNYGVPEYSNLLKNLSEISLPGDSYRLLNEREGTVDGGDFLRDEINDIEETNTGIYLQANYNFELGDTYIDGNFGVRYVETDFITNGFVLFPDYTLERFENETPPGEVLDPRRIPELNLPADDRSFGSGISAPTTFESTFTKALPSFNIRAEIDEGMYLRFAASKAVAYPSLGNRRAFLTVGAETIDVERVPLFDENGDILLDEDGDPIQVIENAEVSFYRASGGNPGLKPMESINLDASYEWYFDDANSLTVSLFYKDLKNFFVNGQRSETITNPETGVTRDVIINGATNGDDGSMRGFEIAYQQFFNMLPEPFDGIGVQANYTRLSSKGVPNANLENGVALDENIDETLPLEQLSDHTANFVLMYEKFGVSARLAYNWRSEFLLTSRDVITRKPVFNEATGQLDGSIFYSVSENIDIGIQAVNLLDETIHLTMLQDGKRLNRSWFNNDRRFSLIVRGNF